MAKLDLRCMQFVDSACEIIQRLTGYLLSPFSKLQNGNGAPHALHLYFRGFFWILQAVACCKKEFYTFWSKNKRGQVTLSNRVTWVFSFACYRLSVWRVVPLDKPCLGHFLLWHLNVRFWSWILFKAGPVPTKGLWALEHGFLSIIHLYLPLSVRARFFQDNEQIF